MKDTHIFYTVCVFATLVIGAIGIGYATDILPLYKQSDVVDASHIDPPPVNIDSDETLTDLQKATTNTLEKKKDCSCCAERAGKRLERIKRIRAKKKTQQIPKVTSK